MFPEQAIDFGPALGRLRPLQRGRISVMIFSLYPSLQCSERHQCRIPSLLLKVLEEV